MKRFPIMLIMLLTLATASMNATPKVVDVDDTPFICSTWLRDMDIIQDADGDCYQDQTRFCTIDGVRVKQERTVQVDCESEQLSTSLPDEWFSDWEDVGAVFESGRGMCVQNQTRTRYYRCYNNRICTETQWQALDVPCPE